VNERAKINVEREKSCEIERERVNWESAKKYVRNGDNAFSKSCGCVYVAVRSFVTLRRRKKNSWSVERVSAREGENYIDINSISSTIASWNNLSCPIKRIWNVFFSSFSLLILSSFGHNKRQRRIKRRGEREKKK
jgi:hypothetical protein